MQLAYFDVNSVSFLFVVSWPVTMAPSLHMGKQAAVKPSPSRVGQSATVTEALSQGHCRTFLRNCKRYRTISSFCIWYIQQKFIMHKVVILTLYCIKMKKYYCAIFLFFRLKGSLRICCPSGNWDSVSH